MSNLVAIDRRACLYSDLHAMEDQCIVPLQIYVQNTMVEGEELVITNECEVEWDTKETVFHFKKWGGELWLWSWVDGDRSDWVKYTPAS